MVRCAIYCGRTPLRTSARRRVPLNILATIAFAAARTFTRTQRAATSLRITTCCRSSAPTRPRTPVTGCTAKAKRPAFLHSSPYSARPTTSTCTTTRRPCSNTKTTWWTFASLTVLRTHTGCPTSWTSSPGPCPSLARRVSWKCLFWSDFFHLAHFFLYPSDLAYSSAATNPKITSLRTSMRFSYRWLTYFAENY